MTRDEDLKNLWAELSKPVCEAEDKGDKEDAPKEAVELEFKLGVFLLIFIIFFFWSL